MKDVNAIAKKALEYKEKGLSEREIADELHLSPETVTWLLTRGIKGGERVGPHLILLAQFFIGYSVTFVGSLIGFGYGFVTGFVAGYVVATLYNWVGTMREARRSGA